MGDIVEDLVVFVQGVCDFVDGKPLGDDQLPTNKRLGLEDAPGFVNRLKEVPVQPVIRLRGIKNGCGLRRGLKTVYNTIDFVYGRIADLRRDEVLEDRVAVVSEVVNGFSEWLSQDPLHGCEVIKLYKYSVFVNFM